MQIATFKAVAVVELTKEGAKIVKKIKKKDYKNTFARMESARTLRFGFNDLMKSISYTKQPNLFLHFLSTLKRSSVSKC